MIVLYSGTPGSGKSLHTASLIYHRLQNNKAVVANFPINFDAIRKKKKKGKSIDFPFLYYDNLDLSPSVLVKYARVYFGGKPIKEGAIVLIVDEAQIIFNSRDWNAAGRRDWLKFFTQHRKYGFDVVLVAQYDDMLDKQIRALIEYEVIHRKASNFGLFGKILGFLTFGQLFCAVRYWYPIKERVSADWFRLKKKYYKLYDTYADFSQFDDE